MKTVGVFICVVLLWSIAARLKRIDCALNGPSCDWAVTNG